MYHVMQDGNILDTIQKYGQDAIDAGAGFVGIEKGGTIDQAVSGAAAIGRDIGVIPNAGQAATAVVDAATGIVNPGGGTTAPVNTSAPPANTSAPATNAPGTGPIEATKSLMQKIPPAGYGAGAAVAVYVASKSFLWSGVSGIATALAVRHMRARAAAAGVADYHRM